MKVDGPAYETPKTSRGRWIAAAALLFAVTVIPYIPAYNAGFYSDDMSNIVDNERLRTTDGLGKIWTDLRGTADIYYPLTFTTYWIEHQLWGTNPRGYHVDNVILHAMNTVLVWLVLRRLGVPGAWVAGAVFGLHPTHVESVAWVTERRNLLSCFFYLLSVFAYLGFRPLGGKREAKAPARNLASRSHLMYGLSLVFFVAAMLSKTATLTLPAALLLLTWWKENRIAWRDVRPLFPFFAVAIGLSLLTIGLERKLVEGGGPGWGTFTLLDRILVAGRAVWFYLAKTLLPVKLSFLYPRWPVDAHSLSQHVYPISAVAFALVLFAARHRIGRAPLVAYLFFCGTLFPVLGFFNFFYMMMSFVADRFLYVPSIGVIAFLVGGAAWGLSCLKLKVAIAGPMLSVVVLAALGAGVWQRAHCFRTPETLYRDVVEKYPESWLGHYNLGCVLAGARRSDEAIEHLEKALSMKTNFPAIRGDLAAVYAEVGRLSDAMPLFKEALRQNPNDVNILTNFGAMYVGMGKYDEAITQYKKALRIDPRYPTALKNLDVIVLFRIDSLFKDGRNNEARAFAEESRTFAVQIGATDIVREIDDLMRANVTPRE